MSIFNVVYVKKPGAKTRTIYKGVVAMKVISSLHVDDLQSLRSNSRINTKYTSKINIGDKQYIPAGMELVIQSNDTDTIDKLIETAEKKQEKNNKS